jgi:hypothetical protein
LEKERVNITMERYEELAMLENRNKIYEAKIEELLAEIRELKKILRSYGITRKDESC